ncbi:MAG: tRNA (adenosine(37)-N6)-threonylcarbamoyltransferase complex dimerization subunit type 1 TsaB [Pyrinomonadaceae bacterium]
MRPPLILAIETATRSGSVCLTRGNDFLAGISDEPTTSHSTHLLPAIQQVLSNAGCTLEEVELFAAASGPGSFTGLRIGLATAKSFAATLNRKCVGVPTLQAIAHAAGPSEHTVALLPAGRGELFAQLFTFTANGEARSIDQAAHLKPAQVWEKYSAFRNLKWAGEGAFIQAPALREYAVLNNVPFAEEPDPATASGSWILVPPRENLAASVAAIAFSEFQRGSAGRAESLKAIYVRPSDAEINQKWPNAKQQSS